jgi:membrane protease YdiL (CAAX protease family)
MPRPGERAEPGEARPWPAFRWEPTDLWPLFLSAFGLSLLVGTFLDEWLGLTGPGSAIALALAHQLSLGLPVLWWLRARGLPVLSCLGLAAVPGRDLLLAFAAGLGVFVVSYVIRELTGRAIEAVLGQPAQARDYAAEFPGVWGVAFSAVAILLAPFLEEVLFRGVLFQGLRNHHRLGVAVAVSAAVFAFTHADLSRMPDLLVSGAAYALMAERSRSLAVPIAAHMASNVLATILTFG